MKKHVKPILILVALLVFTMACTIGYDGINLGFDPDVATYEAQLATRDIDSLTSGNIPEQIEEPAATSEPVDQPGLSSPAENPVLTDDFVEYSVTAINQGCTCAVDGNNNMMSLDVQDDKLILTYSPGGTPFEFQKTSNNTFKRTYMGYYVLVDTTVNPQVETRVDEERHDFIILTKDGFINEHYQGTESSPCCFHTYTSVENAP